MTPWVEGVGDRPDGGRLIEEEYGGGEAMKSEEKGIRNEGNV